jgi:RNase P/RNase MRP subunit POP5
MVVRAKVGRKRYVAFEILAGSDGMTRGKLVKAIGAKADETGLRNLPEVILVENGRGIVRTDQRNLRETIVLLNSFTGGQAGIRLRTLRTSGTIKTLRGKMSARPKTKQ